jgi:hypothetical protein
MLPPPTNGTGVDVFAGSEPVVDKGAGEDVVFGALELVAVAEGDDELEVDPGAAEEEVDTGPEEVVGLADAAVETQEQIELAAIKTAPAEAPQAESTQFSAALWMAA